MSALHESFARSVFDPMHQVSQLADRIAALPKPHGDSLLRRLWLWGLISAAFTALIIQYSFAHGKLLCPPFYDDVSYFEDALHRLAIYYRDGWGALLTDYRHFPPHSPFSSFVALVSFAVFGTHDW